MTTNVYFDVLDNIVDKYHNKEDFNEKILNLK